MQAIFCVKPICVHRWRWRYARNMHLFYFAMKSVFICLLWFIIRSFRPSQHSISWDAGESTSSTQTMEPNANWDFDNAIQLKYTPAQATSFEVLMTGAHPDARLLMYYAGETDHDVKMRVQKMNSFSHPLVTIIIVGHNAEDTIDMSVKSIKSQTWENLQILVIADACTDDTVPILLRMEAADPDPRVEIIEVKSPIGAYRGRNLGLENARGEYVMFHDADDWALPNRVFMSIGPLLEGRQVRFSSLAMSNTRSHCLNTSTTLVMMSQGGYDTRNVHSDAQISPFVGERSPYSSTGDRSRACTLECGSDCTQLLLQTKTWTSYHDSTSIHF